MNGSQKAHESYLSGSQKGIRLNAYADAVIWSEDPSPTLAGLRFGGYAEVVRGLTDAIYGGATIEIEDADGSLLTLKSLSKQYHREVSHEGLYAEATLIAEDEIQESSKARTRKAASTRRKTTCLMTMCLSRTFQRTSAIFSATLEMRMNCSRPLTRNPMCP